MNRIKPTLGDYETALENDPAVEPWIDFWRLDLLMQDLEDDPSIGDDNG